MKLAICISGQPREFKRAYPSFKKNVLDVVDSDIFAYLWQAKTQPHFEIEGSIRYPDEGSLDEFRDLYKPTVFCKEVWDEDREKFFNNPRFLTNKTPFASLVRYQAMLYMIWSANRIKNEYEVFWRKKYDAVIRYRSDVEVLNPINIGEIEKAINGNIFYTDLLREDGMVSDIMWLANKKLMDYACNLWCLFHIYHDLGVVFDTEMMFRAHLRQRGVTVKQHSTEIRVLRPAWVVF